MNKFSIKWINTKILAAALTVIFSISACERNELKWVEVKVNKSDHATPRHENGFIESKGNFYLIGGRGVKPVDIYNPVNNQWRQGPSPPVEIHHFQPVEMNGYILIVGAMSGQYPNEVPHSQILIYDTYKDVWYLGENIPEERIRGAGGCAVYKDKIYWMGGIKRGHLSGHVNYLDEYDPTTRDWRRLPSAPQARDHHKLAVIGDKMYAVGGRRSKAPYGMGDASVMEIESYDFKTNEWSVLDEKLSSPRVGAMIDVIDQKIIICGGEQTDSKFSLHSTRMLDPSSAQWYELPHLIRGLRATDMIIYQQNVFITGGNFMTGDGVENNNIYQMDLSNYKN